VKLCDQQWKLDPVSGRRAASEPSVYIPTELIDCGARHFVHIKSVLGRNYVFQSEFVVCSVAVAYLFMLVHFRGNIWYLFYLSIQVRHNFSFINSSTG